MSRYRGAFSAMAVGLGPGLCAGAMLARRSPIRFDAPAHVPEMSARRTQIAEPVSPQFVEQVSSGSVAGFGAGVLVALFSRTLVFLGGLVAASIHIASRMGIDVTSMLGINKTFLANSKLVKMWQGKPWFTSTFLVTFVLAGFVRL